MENLVFTQLSIPEIRQLFRKELESYFSCNNPSVTPHKETDQLLSVQEAAAFLNLSVPTIYGYVQRQEVPVSKRGKRLYFSRNELTDWVKEGRRKTLSEIEEEADNYLKARRKGGKR